MMKLFTFITVFIQFAAFAASFSSPAYNKLLEKVVTPQGIHWSKIEAADLQKSLFDFENFDESKLTNKNEKLAFWINARNACIFSIIHKNLPLTDVMAINGFREQRFCKVAGVNYSLQELEASRIFSISESPDTLFALWWGTKGGPSLPNQPYVSNDISENLKNQSIKMLSKEKFIEPLTHPYQEIHISSLLDWFKFRFDKSGGVLAYLKKNAPEEIQKKLPKNEVDLKYKPFDWTLDSAKP